MNYEKSHREYPAKGCMRFRLVKIKNGLTSPV